MNDLTDKIRQRAYEIWQYRQENHLIVMLGRDFKVRYITAEDDWLEAERQIKEDDYGRN
jgi:hypothetical protein